MIDPRLVAPTKKNIVKASEGLLSGHLVVFPTETVYGLGASATHEKGINRIYEAKGRPKDHPVIVHVSSISKLEIWAKEIPNYAFELADAFWPGPMTLILKRSEIAKDFVTGGQDTVGLRVPKNEIALTLITEFENSGGFGIAAPSANRFGAVSPTSANHVLAEIEEALNDSDLVLDGGNCQIGIESTIVDCSSKFPKILRPGAILLEEINTLLKCENLTVNVENKVKYSGIFDSHYSPKAKVFLNVTPMPGDGFIAMKGLKTPKDVFRLATPIDINDFANKLYASLRYGDEMKFSRIVVWTPPEKGLGTAINDRLRKAAEK